MTAPQRTPAAIGDGHVGGAGMAVPAPSAPSIPLWEQLVLSVSEAARLCGRSPTTVRKWIEAGLPTIPHTSETFIARAHLDAWLRGEEAA